MLNQDHDLDRMFHALADHNRRAIIEQLSDTPAPVSELAEPLDISLPAVMQHLAVLEACGLVRTHKTGRVRTCELDTAPLSQAERWIHARRRHWETQFDALGHFLDKQQQGTKE